MDSRWCFFTSSSHITRSPGSSSVKQRMVYSASNNALKSRLGVAVEIQGNDEGDLEYATGKTPSDFSMHAVNLLLPSSREGEARHPVKELPFGYRVQHFSNSCHGSCISFALVPSTNSCASLILDNNSVESTIAYVSCITIIQLNLALETNSLDRDEHRRRRVKGCGILAVSKRPVMYTNFRKINHDVLYPLPNASRQPPLVLQDTHLFPSFPQRTDRDGCVWLSLDVLNVQQLVLRAECEEVSEE